MFEPKKTLTSVGHPSIHLVGALSGKRGFDTMRVEMTFLWMSEFCCERVDGSIKCHFKADWLFYSELNIIELTCERMIESLLVVSGVCW